mmetsp:Transcript_29493/g.53703  ORF Transcript_29493/g.53703 Transcript_29493/m.53703 type:complete len:217 (+) Transcript_29493:146-796(+)
MSFSKLKSSGPGTSCLPPSSLSVPGPGSYHPPTQKRRTPTAGMGYGKREWPRDDPVPGPGTYEAGYPLKHVGNRGFGRGPAHVGPDTLPGPGPADYTLKEEYAPLPQRGFGTDKRGIVESTTPGPGAYNGERVRGHVRTVGMGQQHEVFKTQSMTPGPGTYEFHPALGTTKQPQFPIGVNHVGPKVVDTPGPGAYQLLMDDTGGGVNIGSMRNGSL